MASMQVFLSVRTRETCVSPWGIKVEVRECCDSEAGPK